ncbi:MAG TPA: DUF4382 domain-containing protein [Candidatus Eisenbacteria bacterium]|nr:DUF4382 domain-containing protein [Candidatus Eisenbacteria bacterium]
MRKLLIPAVIAIAALYGCGGKTPAPTSPSASVGQFRVLMTDAPAAVQAVNVDVVSVLAHHAGAADNLGWDVLNATPQAVDLLSLQNGAFLALANGSVSSGSYDGLRLVLGNDNTITVDGVTSPLTVPSGAESGLKLQGSFSVPAGGVLALQLDFDAGQSLQQNGGGSWFLRPVLRGLAAADAGAISGTVAPPGWVSGVDVLRNGTTITSVVPGASGVFVASVLPAGTYDVVVHGAAGDRSFPGVIVTAGSTTSLGVIDFSAGSGDGGGTQIID